jgi:predicted transposase/invertase (TIGR01784 family)
MAGEVLLRISKDEVERARLMSEYKYAVDTQSKVVQAKREGRQEGRQEEKKEIARNMKAMGLSAAQVTKATGLSEKQIEEL